MPTVASGCDDARMSPHDRELLDELERSRSLGFLGPGPVRDHVAHATEFGPLIEEGARVLDLGSGGGVPGLVLARRRPDLTVTLVDASTRRTDFLRESLRRLALVGQAEVRTGRAEVLAHDPGLRHRFDVVVSRSFGPPAATAECAVGFLQGAGALILVSEPPPDLATDRWPAEGLAALSLRVGPMADVPHATIQVLQATDRCATRFPRAVGRPTKRPLF